MRIQQDALNVLQRTSQYLKSNVLNNQPAWFKVVAQHPPNKDLTRKIKSDPSKQVDKINNASIKSSSLYRTKLSPSHFQNKLFKSSKIRFLEDDLRQLFYDQHPWELATPKNLIENQYLNDRKLDWSHIQQLYKPLDAESVVQRTLYLVLNEDLSILQLYDKARFEFYRLKIDADIEQSVSKEELLMSGALFEPSMIQKGFDLELKYLDKWRDQAVLLTLELDARMSRSYGKANLDSEEPSATTDDLDISQLESFEELSKGPNKN